MADFTIYMVNGAALAGVCARGFLQPVDQLQRFLGRERIGVELGQQLLGFRGFAIFGGRRSEGGEKREFLKALQRMPSLPSLQMAGFCIYGV